MPDPFSAQLSYPAYTAGTQAYVNAVRIDYERNLITSDQAISLLQGYTDPATGKLIAPQPSGWTTFFSSLTGAVGVLGTAYNRMSQLELQKAQNELRILQEKRNLTTGMFGEGSLPGFGGINMFTLLAIGGVVLAAMFLLKKT